jgi:RpiB/LacA/LacB family sugar-phosphate isomerase
MNRQLITYKSLLPVQPNPTTSRCGLCWNLESARLTKEHNNANMISLGARMVSVTEGIKIVDTWLDAEFQGGRHQTRIDKIETVEANKPTAGSV